ncbi:MAG: nucleotidyltransferase domain-containing protein [Candidatus Melainabacteria bacterium]|nr:nucleotidyltransferase domain-containing protein [Candidatus Melainabacteria bacterium]
MTLEFQGIKDFELFLNQNNIFDLLGVDNIGIFGSFARGEPAHDIDLLLENITNKNKLIEIKEDLEKKIGKKIDVVIDQYTNPIILHRAKKDIIYVKKYKK